MLGCHIMSYSKITQTDDRISFLLPQHAGVERHGLKRAEMEEILRSVGFNQVEVFESFKMDKEVETGGKQSFPFLAITGVRP